VLIREATPNDRSQGWGDTCEELEIRVFEPPIAAVAVCLDPSPTAECVATRDHCLVADSNLPQDFIPARRAGKIAAGIATQLPDRLGPPSDRVHCREVPRVLQLEDPGNTRAIVVLGNARKWNERVWVGQNPTPAIEADHALKLDNRFAVDRFGVAMRLA
jgi:hypothetical protein